MEDALIRHEEIVKFLSQYKTYQYADGSAVFPLRKKPISGYNTSNFDTNQVNHLVILIAEVLNLTGGSVGNFDLYNLLQAYFLDEGKRNEINRII